MGGRFPEAGIRDGCMCWEPNPGALQDQYVLNLLAISPAMKIASLRTIFSLDN